MSGNSMNPERKSYFVEVDQDGNSPLSKSVLAQTEWSAMNGEPLRSKVTITNPQGFHMRPQSAFAQLASKFQSSVFLYDTQNQQFDGKSPFSLLGLLAEQGTEITLEVNGEDQDRAFEELLNLLSNMTRFEEESSE